MNRFSFVCSNPRCCSSGGVGVSPTFMSRLLISSQICAAAAAPQVVLVSATLPNEVLQMTQQFMTDPVKILVKRDELTLEVSVYRSKSS